MIHPLPAPRGIVVLFVCLVLTLAGLAPGWSAQPPITRLTTDGRSTTIQGGGWSPDGAYFLYAKSFPEGQQLWVMQADGGKASAVSRIGAVGQIGWAPNSQYLVYSYAEKNVAASAATINLYDVTSGQTRQLAANFKWDELAEADCTGYQEILWTRDASAFAMVIKRKALVFARADATIFELSNGAYTKLTPNFYCVGATFPGTWLPGDQQFMCIAKDVQGTNFRIYKVNRDGSGLQALTPADSYVHSDPMLSPNGDLVVYSSNEGLPKDQKDRGCREIWVMSPDGTNRRPITTTATSVAADSVQYWWPRWTHDGRFIVAHAAYFSKDSTGYREIGNVLIDPYTGEIIKVFTPDPNGDQTWNVENDTLCRAPDGRTIAFIYSQWTVRAKGTQDESYDNARTSLAWYDIPSKQLTTLETVRAKEDGYVYSPLRGSVWPVEVSPDGRKMVFTKGKVTSYTQRTVEPDLYVAMLPEPAVPVTTPVVSKPAETAAAIPAAATPSTTATAPTADTAKAAVAEKVTVLYAPKYRRAKEIADAMPAIYSGMVKVDDGGNQLLLTPKDADTRAALERDIALVDRPTPLVMVDVLVTELTREASKELGLNWEFARGRLSGTLPTGDDGSIGNIIYQGVGTIDRKFFGTLSALADRGKATVRANPRVLTRSGTQASISIRRTKNFLFVSGTDYNGRPVKQRSDISADIIVKVTPVLLADNRIAVSLDATVDSFIFGSKNDLPDTTRRQAITDLTMGNGETVIIGGLTLQEESRNVSKTPLLGDIPVLGKLFQHESRLNKESNIVIFLSPHVVRPGDQPVGPLTTIQPTDLTQPPALVQPPALIPAEAK